MMMWENYSDEIIEELKFIPFSNCRHYVLVVAFNNRCKNWFIRALSSAKIVDRNIQLANYDYGFIQEAVEIDDRATFVDIDTLEDFDDESFHDLEVIADVIKFAKRIVAPNFLKELLKTRTEIVPSEC